MRLYLPNLNESFPKQRLTWINLAIASEYVPPSLLKYLTSPWFHQTIGEWTPVALSTNDGVTPEYLIRLNEELKRNVNRLT